MDPIWSLTWLEPWGFHLSDDMIQHLKFQTVPFKRDEEYKMKQYRLIMRENLSNLKAVE